jgi:hypothetical protein
MIVLASLVACARQPDQPPEPERLELFGGVATGASREQVLARFPGLKPGPSPTAKLAPDATYETSYADENARREAVLVGRLGPQEGSREARFHFDDEALSMVTILVSSQARSNPAGRRDFDAERAQLTSRLGDPFFCELVSNSNLTCSWTSGELWVQLRHELTGGAMVTSTLYRRRVPDTGQEIWRGARQGMTPEAVQRRFPRARPDGRGSPNASLIFPLSTSAEAFGQPATANFRFVDGRLMQVQLDFADQRNKRNGGVLRDEISAEFGRPKLCDNKSPFGLEVAMHCEWSKDRLRVLLVVLQDATEDLGAAVYLISTEQPNR